MTGTSRVHHTCTRELIFKCIHVQKLTLETLANRKFSVPYDMLVVGVGASVNTFGIKTGVGFREFCFEKFDVKNLL